MRAVHCERIPSRDSEHASENEDEDPDQEYATPFGRSVMKSRWILGGKPAERGEEGASGWVVINRASKGLWKGGVPCFVQAVAKKSWERKPFVVSVGVRYT